MSGIKLDLPVLQNWSCHNCGGCCKQHLIEVTEAERQRILDQKWTADDGVKLPVLVWHAGPPWKKRYRLAHQADGGCVFLDERGLCRIHAKFGEQGKPLACRIYPYAFHPAGKAFAVSLRFSCPSVVANQGTPVSQQTGEIRRLAAAVVPSEAKNSPPPQLTSREAVDWTDFLVFNEALDHTLADPSVPLVVRIARAVTWTILVGQSSMQQLRGSKIREFIGLLLEATRMDLPSMPETIEAPTSIAQIYFRMLVAQYARKDTVADLSAGFLGRWKLLRSIVKFTRGKGQAPPLQSAFQPVPFETIEQPFGPIPPAAEEILTRYFRVKIQGLHYCGPAYYGVPFVEGFHSLALMLPVTMWLARWLAAGQGRQNLTTEDISQALAIADHHHGYSPALGAPAARTRVRWLAESGDLTRLCFWYSK